MIERILELMQERKMNGVQLSLECGFAKNAISEWKIGRRKPGSKAIQKLAHYFDVTTDYLYGRTDERSGMEANVNENASLKVKGKNNLAIQQGVNNGPLTISGGQRGGLSDEASELLAIYGSLKVKKKIKLLEKAYALKEEQSAEDFGGQGVAAK